MVYILFGEGFEEVEALCVADVLRRGGVEGMVPVDDQQRSLEHLPPMEDDRSHASTPSSMIRLTSVVNPQPAAAIMLG